MRNCCWELYGEMTFFFLLSDSEPMLGKLAQKQCVLLSFSNSFPTQLDMKTQTSSHLLEITKYFQPALPVEISTAEPQWPWISAPASSLKSASKPHRPGPTVWNQPKFPSQIVSWAVPRCHWNWNTIFISLYTSRNGSAEHHQGQG